MTRDDPHAGPWIMHETEFEGRCRGKIKEPRFKPKKFVLTYHYLCTNYYLFDLVREG
jgi:hypothetical protein